MTYTHLITEELVMIEAYFHQNILVLKIAAYVGRSRQTIHNVVTFLRKGYTALDYFKQYKKIRNGVVDTLFLYHITNKNTFKRWLLKDGLQMSLLGGLKKTFLAQYVLCTVSSKNEFLIKQPFQ